MQIGPVRFETFRPGSAPAPKAAAPEPAPARREPRKPKLSEDDLKWLRDVRHPTTTTYQERVQLAESLMDRLTPQAAGSAARLIVAVASGQTGCGYHVGDEFQVDVKYTRPRPVEEVTSEFREMLDRLTQTRNRRDASLGWGDAGKAEFAMAIVNGPLVDKPDQAKEFLGLMHDFGDPHIAWNLLHRLEKVPAEHRAAVRQAIDRAFTHDEKGQPRRWGPPQDWLKSSKRLLFMASLLEPGQPLELAQAAVTKLGPRMDALFQAEAKVYSNHKQDDERFRQAALRHRDPGETPFQALDRQFDLIDRLSGAGLKVQDQRHGLESLGYQLDFWRQVMPGESAQTLLSTLVDGLLASGIPVKRLSPLFSQLKSQVQPGESPAETLARMAQAHDRLEGRLARYGEEAVTEGFEAAVGIPGAPVELLADLADRWKERHADARFTGSFFYAARALYEPGDTAQTLGDRMERNYAYTGAFDGLKQLGGNFNWLEKDGKLSSERRQELQEQAPGWLTGFRLSGQPDPRGKLWEHVRDRPDEPLGPAVRQGPEGDVIDRLEVSGRPLHQTLAEVGAALGETFRLGKRLSYTEPELVQAMRVAIREAGPEGAFAFPAFLEELGAGDRAPKAEELPEMVRATVATQAAGSLMAGLPLEKRLERVAHSHYLTGSYRGLQQAHERLEAWQNAGILRQDVPFQELYGVLEKHILQLRITGTPAEKTLEAAFQRLRESEYATEGSPLGQQMGIVGEKLAVGSVPVKIRKRS